MRSVAEIDDWIIDGVLGQGSFGTVYRAHREGRTAALKWMHGLDPGSREALMRFHREVDIASGLSHPNLIQVLGSGNFRERPYLVMELIEGPPLSQLMARHPQGAGDAEFRAVILKVAHALFEALDYIHSRHVVHRDLKPENVYIDSEGRPRLGDFGLAVVQDTMATRSVEGTVAGTIAYMAPEVLRGEDADRRSDMFSLGILLMQLIAGTLPYRVSEFNAIMYALMTEGPLPLSSMAGNIPEALDACLARMTAVRPEDRYFTMAQAWKAWQEATSGWGQTSQQAARIVPELLQPAFVGRKAALKQLDEALAQARRGQRQMVRVGGPAGIGRTRLLQHWVRQEREAACILKLHTSKEGQTPFYPFPHLVRHDRPEVMERALFELAGSDVLVLMLDDAHLMDAASERFIRYLMSKTDGRLLIVLAEPDPDGLPPLSTEEVDALVRSALGLGDQAPPPEVSRMLEFAEGHPQAIMESLDNWLQDGVLVLTERGWQWTES